MVAGDLEMLVARDVALCWHQFADHELEQRRLAHTVGPHQRDPRVAVHAQVQVLVQRILHAAAVRERHRGEGQHRRRQLLRGREAELEGAPGAHGLCQAGRLHLVDDLLLGLGLAHQVGEGTAGRDELPQVLDVRLLLLVPLLLVDLQLLLGGHELVVVAAVHLQTLLVRDVDDLVAHAVQKVLRVRHHDQAAVELVLQILLQPHTRLQVEMVGRLIQQQNVGLDEQRTRQRHAHAPATRHVLGGSVHHHLVEAQTVKDAASLDLERLRLHRLDAVHHVLQLVRVRLSLLAQPRLVILQPMQLRLGRRHHVGQRRLIQRRRLRVQQEHVHVRRDGHVPVGQALEEGGLASPVVPDQTVPPADGELDHGVLDQLLTIQRQREVVDLDVARSGPRHQHARR
mmetsp:Transcript_8617/g.27092  ORF Transcript_8617/g.27092 Transcript_8617/m.27092 type:complete len:399 (+) Transcript_8617:581-1777(+)